MTTSLQGTHIDLTSEAHRHVDAALEAVRRSLNTLAARTAHAAVELERTSEMAYRAEITLHMGQATIRAEATADTLRQSLNDVQRVVVRRVRKEQARRRDAQRVAPALPLADLVDDGLADDLDAA